MYLPRICQGGTASGTQVVPGSQNINWSVSLMGFRGLGGCGCGCGGSCGNKGMGQAPSFPTFYAPFTSTDYTEWGWEEYAIIVLLGYGVLSFLVDTFRIGKRARKGYKRSRSRSKRRARARREYEAI
jgi:hypothetical protein